MILRRSQKFFFWKASQGHYVGIRRAGMGGVGLDLVGSEDRSYRTPLVHFLHGHHYWPFQFFFTVAMAHQRGQKCQRAVLRCATIFRTCTGTKFSTRTKYQNGLKQYLSAKFSTRVQMHSILFGIPTVELSETELGTFPIVQLGGIIENQNSDFVTV